jgi:phage shock protein PspC (stress-responsive transcriptional regulator)
MDTNSNIDAGSSAAPGSPQVRRLYRRTDRRVVAGVAAGLGDYFEVDPVWIRLLFVLTALIGALGIVAYGALWLLVPPAVGPVPDRPRTAGRRGRTRDRIPVWIGMALIAVGALILADRFLSWTPEGLFWGAVLIVLGVALFRSGDRTAQPVDRRVGGRGGHPADGGSVAGRCRLGGAGAASGSRAAEAPTPPGGDRPHSS